MWTSDGIVQGEECASHLTERYSVPAEGLFERQLDTKSISEDDPHIIPDLATDQLQIKSETASDVAISWNGMSLDSGHATEMSSLRPMPSIGLASRKRNMAKTTCSNWHEKYETSMPKLREHFQRHLHDLKAEWLCGTCCVGFVHETDYQHHVNSAKAGHCGFAFRHTTACTGHHAPVLQRITDETMKDHDRFKFGFLIRNWEQSQLHLYQLGAQRVIEERTNGHFSVLTFAELRRFSLASFKGSLRTFMSEPYDNDPKAKMNIESLKKQLARINLGAIPQIVRKNTASQVIEDPTDSLLAAASSGNVKATKRSIDAGAIIDGPPSNASHHNPLMVALEKGLPHVAVTLVKRGAKFDTTFNDGRTALHQTAVSGHIEVARAMLRRIDARSFCTLKDAADVTPLHKSVMRDDVELTNLVLASIRPRELEDVEKAKMLHSAVEVNGLGTANALLKFGVNPDVSNGEIEPTAAVLLPMVSIGDFGLRPIHTACRLGHERMVSLLVAAGASVDIIGPMGTPLDVAVKFNQMEIVGLLGEKGAMARRYS